MDQLINNIPVIKELYRLFEEEGYNAEQILQKFKNKHPIKSLKTESAKITYNSVGQELADMDSRRGSWTNEDPDWHAIAVVLDTLMAAVSSHRDRLAKPMMAMSASGLVSSSFLASVLLRVLNDVP
jgi:hypothetical protein